MTTPTRKTPQLEIPSLSVGRPKLNTGTTNAKPTTSNRLPPPALFQGPPSKNASHISLALPERPGTSDGEHQRSMPRASRVPPAASFSGAALPNAPALKQSARADEFRAENLWAEMQKTLADVELSAMNPSHVFSATHAKALEDLRTAQLTLAQAWAKSEADEMGDMDMDLQAAEANVGSLNTRANPTRRGRNDDARGDFSNNKNLEEETERDIQLARKRREANDRYFQQVNTGVLDVVSHLDQVANAMRRVEKESREIWDESSDETGSVIESVTATDATDLTDSPVAPKR